MVAQARLISDVVHDDAPHGLAAANRSAFVSATDRFADLRANAYYSGNSAASTTRPFLMPHKAATRANVGPTAYFPRDQHRPRTTSPDFTRRRARGECFDRTEDQKSTEFVFRDSRWSLEKDAQHWARVGSSFSRASQRPPTKKKQKSQGSLLFNPDRGGQGGGKYQSIGSATSAAGFGSPQKYSAAFRGTGRDGAVRKLETSKARRERECRERLGPGTYSAPSADQLSGSKSKARFSPVFMPAPRAAHDTTRPSTSFTPGPGQYDAADIWKQKVAPRAARGEVRMALVASSKNVVGSGQPAPTDDPTTSVPLRGTGTWSLETEFRRWRKRGGSPVGAFSGQQRLTLDTRLSYTDVISSVNVSAS